MLPYFYFLSLRMAYFLTSLKYGKKIFFKYKLNNENHFSTTQSENTFIEYTLFRAGFEPSTYAFYARCLAKLDIRH